ncbi:MAG: antibiotic biosynthesis monooxygenase [Zoogloea sp.]|nr:antibiotic biosynthesis monooxygenase [Zoogloea sp.]
MSLSVVATITAKPEFRADVRRALDQVIPPSRAEAACQHYELHITRDKPDSFVMIERWQDDAALERHMATSHFAALVAAIDGKVTGVDIVRLDPAA